MLPFSPGSEPEPELLSCAASKDEASERIKSISSRIVGGGNATYAPYQVFYLWAIFVSHYGMKKNIEYKYKRVTKSK